MKNQFLVQTVLNLSCAAQRRNESYIKEVEIIQADDETVKSVIYSNKLLIRSTLGDMEWVYGLPPKDLVVLEEDIQLADEIRKFFRRLSFKVISDNISDFDQKIHALLNSETVSSSDLGFIACLPSVYFREESKIRISNIIKECTGYLGTTGQVLTDLDSEILEVTRSNNYDAWNITAIIDKKLSYWMTSNEVVVGPAVIIKAKVKEHSMHWKYLNPMTRLHYVKVAQ